MMNGHWIDIKAHDGRSFGAYVSTPPKATQTGGPGIVLIQEIWGVNQHIRDVADQYAMDGFMVFAPDVFWRQQPRVDLGYNEVDNPKAFAFMNGLDRVNAAKDLTATAAALRSHPTCGGKIASVGYCMGGALSFICAATGSVDAAVCYYGGGIHTMLDRVPDIKVPMLLHFAEKDGHIPMSAVESVQTAFKGRDEARIDVYPGVDHGFNCWGRAMYNQKAAALARGRSLAFLAGTIA
jgi:carboxymethylenebutenolidase